MTLNKGTTSLLNELIETSKDGQKGFAKAAEETRDPTLKAFFVQGAQRCAEGARELQAKVVSLGAKAEDSGSVKGAAHRGWLDVKSAVTGRDSKAILEEVERGEDYAKGKYNEVLKQDDLPEDVRDLVARQYEGVLQNHDRVRELRDQYRAGA